MGVNEQEILGYFVVVVIIRRRRRRQGRRSGAVGLVWGKSSSRTGDLEIGDEDGEAQAAKPKVVKSLRVSPSLPIRRRVALASRYSRIDC